VQTPRDYQASALRNVLAAFKLGALRVLLRLPTGGGKTTVFGILAAQITAPVLIVVHRRELARQAANRLREFGVDFGFIVAGEQPKPYARVQIGMIQTLAHRKTRPKAGLVICDEAHLSTAATWSKLLEEYPNARILGVTATPWRLSGKPLAAQYDQVVVGAAERELRERGFLCPYVGFSYKSPDLSDVKTTGGDFDAEQSAEKMREPSIVANVVEKWLEHASHLTTIVYAVTVEHSKELCAKFKAAGVVAEHIDGSTPKLVRDAAFARLEAGTLRVLCNVGIAIEGVDVPRIKCVVLARPTKSLTIYLQSVGRGRRPWNGETLRIHDHAFLIKKHGLPDDDRDYSLDARKEDPPAVTQCELCFANYRGPKCPSCDHENEKRITGPREIRTVDDAEAFEFASGGEKTGVEPKPVVRPEDRPPVDKRWDNPGAQVEGVFLGEGAPRRVGDRTVQTWRVRGARRIYDAPKAAHLDQLIAAATKSGALVPGVSPVRMTYLRDQNLGGERWRREFRLEVDDGT
jgi:DNA repair protein RadD